MINLKNLKYKNQCMDDGVVSIYDGDERCICNMFIDDDGDIGFWYQGEEIYFKDIEFIG